MMDEACDSERRANFDAVVALLAKSGGGSKGKTADVVALGCEATELHIFVYKRAAAADKEDELLALAQLVCFWDSAAMPWCLHTLANTGGAASCSNKNAQDRNSAVAEWGAATGEDSLGRGGTVLGMNYGADASASSHSAMTWIVLLRRALELRLVTCALLLRSGPVRYALAQIQEEELIAVAQRASATTAAHFALLSPYPAGKKIVWCT